MRPQSDGIDTSATGRSLEYQAANPLKDRSSGGIGTLSRIIEALGGELELIAHLPGVDVRLNQFRQNVQRHSLAVRL